MGSLSLKLQPGKALRLAVTEDALTLDLSEGRTVSAPLRVVPSAAPWKRQGAKQLAAD